MSIISLLREVFSSGKIQKGITKPDYTEQDNALSDELCSKDMKTGDYFGLCARGRRPGNIDFKAEREKVFEKENISWLDRAVYKVKTIFSSQEDRLESIRCSIREMSNLSEAERIKRYSEVYREYLMEAALIDEFDVEAEKQLAALIPDLRATCRLGAAKNMISLGESAEAVNRRSRIVQKNAREILTKRDMLGKLPSREDAVEMQCFTFKHMNEQGIHESLGELRDSEKRYQELKKLADSGELPDDLKDEYEFCELAHTQYTTTGYAGAYAGIGTNAFISQESAEYYAGIVADDTTYFGISNEVLDLVRTFAETHPDEFAETGAENFRAFMDRATGGAYTARENEDSGIQSAAEVNDVVSATAQQTTADAFQNAETAENAMPSAYSSIAPAAGKENSDNKTNSTAKTNKTDKTGKTISNPIIQKFGNSGMAASSPILKSAEKVPQSISACKTVAEIERCMEEKNISKREACIQIFEDNNLDRYKEQFGIKLFMLIGDDMKDITFGELSGRGKVAVASAMNYESLEKLNISDSSFYVKMYVTNLKKEKEKLRGETSVKNNNKKISG